MNSANGILALINVFTRKDVTFLRHNLNRLIFKYELK